MRYARLLPAALLGLLLAVPQARAVSLLPGQTLNDPPTNLTVAAPVGTLLASVTNQAFTGLDALGNTAFTGTITLQVIREASGFLAFTYQVTNSSSSRDPIDRLTTTSFDGWTTDVGYVAGAGTDVHQVDRTSVRVGFTFGGSGGINPQNLVQGATSDLLVIRTNATAFTRGSVSVINGGTADIVGFAPSPEPSTLALAGLALPLVGLGYLRRRRQA